MIKARLSKRSDAAGEGHFGASRGSRTHKGQDYECFPGAIIESPIKGYITKLGYPYADDLSYRYVEITQSLSTNKYRIFYVEPSVKLGDGVLPGDAIGAAQDVAKRYPNESMTCHVHLEIKLDDGSFTDPEAE